MAITRIDLSDTELDGYTRDERLAFDEILIGELEERFPTATVRIVGGSNETKVYSDSERDADETEDAMNIIGLITERLLESGQGLADTTA